MLLTNPNALHAFDIKKYAHRFNVNEGVTLQAGKGENHLRKG